MRDNGRRRRRDETSIKDLEVSFSTRIRSCNKGIEVSVSDLKISGQFKSDQDWGERIGISASIAFLGLIRRNYRKYTSTNNCTK